VDELGPFWRCPSDYYSIRFLISSQMRPSPFFNTQLSM
jgi:hypothetical protein